MVVFRRDDYETIGPFHRCRKVCIFDGLAGIVCREVELANIDQLGFDAFVLLNLAEYKPGDVFTRASFSCRAENHWNEEWSSGHRGSLSIVARENMLLTHAAGAHNMRALSRC